MLALGNEVLQFFCHPETEFKEGFHIDRDAAHTFVVAEYKLDFGSGFLGHCDCLQ